MEIKLKTICRFHTSAAHLGMLLVPSCALQPCVVMGASAWNALLGLQGKPAFFGDAEIILLIEAVNVNDH